MGDPCRCGFVAVVWPFGQLIGDNNKVQLQFKGFRPS